MKRILLSQTKHFLFLCFVSPVLLLDPVFADGFQQISFKGARYSVFIADSAKTDIRLLWRGENGERIATLSQAETYINQKNHELLFATNAGIFNPAHEPLGLHIENGQKRVPLNLSSGKGNFFLKPNGVFYISKQGASVTPAKEFRADKSIITAVQSGPLLLTDNKIHPKFSPNSKNKLVRSGVGVNTLGEVVFVFSEQAVNFFDFAVFFRDKLRCPNALYLDGVISGILFPSKQIAIRSDQEFAGIFVVVRKKP